MLRTFPPLYRNYVGTFEGKVSEGSQVFKIPSVMNTTLTMMKQNS